MKQIIEKGDNLIKYLDGSARVKCSLCGEWEEVKAGSNQANLLQIEGKEKGWECRKCWLVAKDVPNDEPKSWEIGQAINLANGAVLTEWQVVFAKLDRPAQLDEELLKRKLDSWFDFYLRYIRDKQKENNNGKS